MTDRADKVTTPNPLAGRDPGLLRRLAAFRSRVNDLLLDRLAAAARRDAASHARERRQPLEDIEATAQILRVLTKQAWDATDLRLLDTYWRDETRSELFADEFEGERHLIRHYVDAARRQLAPTGRTPNAGR